MNGLSGRERRLLIVLGGVLVVMIGVFVLGRGGGGASEVPDVSFPTPTAASPTPTASEAVTFVVPDTARDPFGGGGGGGGATPTP